MNQGTPEATSWLDTIKQTFNNTMLKEKFNLSRQKLAELALFFGIGFLCGFLIKRYAHILVLVILLFIVCIALQQLGFVSFVVHWEKIQHMIGIVQIPGQEDWFAVYWAWVKLNWALVASVTVGALLGVKFG